MAGTGLILLWIYLVGMVLVIMLFGLIWACSNESERREMEDSADPIGYSTIVAMVGLLWPYIVLKIMSEGKNNGKR